MGFQMRQRGTLFNGAPRQRIHRQRNMEQIDLLLSAFLSLQLCR
jgi:hypothetical protein